MTDTTDEGAKHALLIAYQYPPCQQSSGYLRTLAFSRYLSEFGWAPVVLTASERAYKRSNATERDRIPKSVPVVRAFARDARDLFSIRGKYPAFMAIPDRQNSWWLGAVPAGLKLIRRYKPHVLWATQPTPTAFWIAHTLHRITGIPWVADFRDPVAMDGSPLANRMRRWIERKTVYSCSGAVFTTPGAASSYARAYSDIPEQRWRVIPNGYDENDFDELDTAPAPRQGRPLKLIHSGVVYRDGRDPRALFDAIRELKLNGSLAANEVTIIFRASGSENYFQRLVDDAGISDVVKLLPPLPYREALAEICTADGLLVLQGSQFNGQVPAKIYEYFRARRPIIALTDPSGNTASALRQAGIEAIVPIDQSSDIAVALQQFVSSLRAGTAAMASDEAIAQSSRESGVRVLADVFDSVVSAKNRCD